MLTLIVLDLSLELSNLLFELNWIISKCTGLAVLTLKPIWLSGSCSRIFSASLPWSSSCTNFFWQRSGRFILSMGWCRARVRQRGLARRRVNIRWSWVLMLRNRWGVLIIEMLALVNQLSGCGIQLSLHRQLLNIWNWVGLVTLCLILRRGSLIFWSCFLGGGTLRSDLFVWWVFHVKILQIKI